MSVFDPKWRYATSDETKAEGYLRRKFQRIRAEQKAAAEIAKAKDEAAMKNVKSIKKVKA